MPELRLRLGTKFRAAIAVVSLLAIGAVTVSIYTFHQAARSDRDILNRVVATEQILGEIDARTATAIALIGGADAVSRTGEQRNSHHVLSEEIGRIKKLLPGLGKVMASDGHIGEFSLLLDNFAVAANRWFDFRTELDRLAGRRAIAIRTVQESVQGSRNLLAPIGIRLRDALRENGQAATGSDRPGNGGTAIPDNPDSINSIESLLRDIRDAVTGLELARTGEEISAARQIVSETLRALVRATVDTRIPGVASAVRPALSSTVGALNDRDGAFGISENLVAGQLRAATMANDIFETAGRLNELKTAMSEETRRVTEAAVEQADRAARNRALWHVLLSIAVVSAAALIAWFFIFRKVLFRIRRLADAANRMVAGKPGTVVSSDGNDELSEIARTIEGFRENAARLVEQEERLTAADREVEQSGKEAIIARQRLQEAIETIPIGFALWDGEDNLILLNERYREQRPEMAPYIDHNPGFEEFSRRSIEGRLPNASPETVDEILQSALERYSSGETRDLIQGARGNWVQMDVRRTAEGGYIVAYTDTTELFEARNRLETAVEHMHNGFMLWNPQRKLILVNEEARSLLHDRADLLVEGTSLEDFALATARTRKPDASEEEWTELAEAMIKRHFDPGEPYEVLLPDGTWVLVSNSELDNGGAVSVIADISEQKSVQKFLEDQAAELQRSNKELEQFAYLASHDLQEPLRVIGSYCNLIDRRYSDILDDDGREFLGYAVDGAQRMRSLIDDLLTYSRVGREDIVADPVDLNECVETALGSLQTLTRENDTEISVDELPTVSGNQALIAQVFQNLIGNAIKFRREVPPRIRISASRAGPDWVIRVADNGIGIKKEFRERVFRIFQRLHTRDEFSGNGLGLALCQRIVDQHRGKIWIEDPEDAGTIVCFSFPVLLA